MSVGGGSEKLFAVSLPYRNVSLSGLKDARARQSKWTKALGLLISVGGLAYLTFHIFKMSTIATTPETVSVVRNSQIFILTIVLLPFLLTGIFQRFCRQNISLTKTGLERRAFLQFGKIEVPVKLPLVEKHLWSDLDCVRFQVKDGLSAVAALMHGRGDCLVFDWKSKRDAPGNSFANTSFINLSLLSEREREKLFSTMALCVVQELLAPEALYLQVQTLSGQSQADGGEYTKVWLDEYSRNFELSNYVTIPPGTLCGQGRFIIKMLIAARFNSSTYLAANHSGQKFVVKELLPPIDGDNVMQEKMLEQFNREAAILAKLHHPAIVSVVDHFIENGRTYIVMTHAPGRNIREFVRLNGPMSSADAVKIGAQLASVLHYLHHHSPAVLHRDFTPDNLMYDDDGTITVVDFGAANLYNTGKTATLIGKQSYMPPEQLRGKVSPASDIYAFGATLSYLLTAKDLPSMGKVPTFPPQVDSALAAMIERCTAFAPQSRPDCDEVRLWFEQGISAVKNR